MSKCFDRDIVFAGNGTTILRPDGQEKSKQYIQRFLSRNSRDTPVSMMTQLLFAGLFPSYCFTFFAWYCLSRAIILKGG
jgi:hypothetical protein